MITEVTLVNAVGGGSVGVEFDLTELQAHLPYSSEYEPEQHPGLYFKSPKTGVTVMLFRSGEYHLSGGRSIDELHQTKDWLISSLIENVPKSDVDKLSFEVRNLVHTANVGQELELSELAISFGLDNTEYNPEQFPGLVYSSKDFEGTFLIFRSGKCILTGCKDMADVENSFNKLEKTLVRLFEGGD